MKKKKFQRRFFIFVAISSLKASAEESATLLGCFGAANSWNLCLTNSLNYWQLLKGFCRILLRATFQQNIRKSIHEKLLKFLKFLKNFPGKPLHVSLASLNWNWQPAFSELSFKKSFVKVNSNVSHEIFITLRIYRKFLRKFGWLSFQNVLLVDWASNSREMFENNNSEKLRNILRPL